MILVTVECLGNEIASGDMRTFDRVIRGLSNLSKDGYRIERYDAASVEGHNARKKVVVIERTSGANDADFEKWLQASFAGKESDSPI